MRATSRIIIDNSIQDIQPYIKDKKKLIVITDSNVFRLYGDIFKTTLSGAEVIGIGMGEKIKNLHTVNYIYEKLMDTGADRFSFILGVGGGIVCDITGFVASTFMRGVHFAFVPTTLLAQVDASIGGKNGVNFKNFKNIIGVFNQPDFIFSDFNFLHTLDKKELACGLAEVIKAALIQNSDLVDFIEKKHDDIVSLQPDAINRIVGDSVRIKSDIVFRDEFERDERRKLNFGHTIAHALEKVSALSHGEAVSIGMMFASKFSEALGYLTSNDVKRIREVLEQYGLPVSLDINKMEVIEAIKHDKKQETGDIHFVFLKGIGRVYVEKISFDRLKEAIGDLC